MRKGRQRNGDVVESEAGSETSPTGITNIPTDLLRTFVAICELGSFTKAANLFDLTQPAVSAHMRRLESMIGADLIEKSLSGITLTECGTEVLRYARHMLAIIDQIVSGAHQLPAGVIERIAGHQLEALLVQVVGCRQVERRFCRLHVLHAAVKDLLELRLEPLHFVNHGWN